MKPLAFDSQSVPLLDVTRATAPMRDEILAAIAAVFDSGRFLHGPDVQQLETGLASLCATRYAVACASGSDALLLALMALDVGPGDEVIVPSFTFFATASAVWRLGAKVVFTDIEPSTFNIDPDQVQAAITARTKAVIPVHLFGQCARMDALCEICSRHKVHVVEDVAQAIGARYAGRPAGSWGRVSCFSFYPTKNLGGCGDGGMLTTNDEQLQQRLRLMAAHGMKPRYVHRVVGINSRLDSMQAAALCVKLEHLAEWTAQRQANAATYQRLFAETGLDRSAVRLPVAQPQCAHVWNQFTIRVAGGRRDALRRYLAEHGIGTEIYYPYPLHLQECFRECGYAAGSLPESERAAREVISLPIFPGLTPAEQRTVVGRITEFLSAGNVAAA